MNPDVKALIDFRLAQSDEDLRASEALLEGGFAKAAINRAYYAMFHAANALLVSRGVSAAKHSGVLSRIMRDFVKTGALPNEAGRRFLEAFELRQKADYRDYWHADETQAREVLRWAEEFVQQARAVLRSSGAL